MRISKRPLSANYALFTNNFISDWLRPTLSCRRDFTAHVCAFPTRVLATERLVDAQNAVPEKLPCAVKPFLTQEMTTRSLIIPAIMATVENVQAINFIARYSSRGQNFYWSGFAKYHWRSADCVGHKSQTVILCRHQLCKMILWGGIEKIKLGLRFFQNF